MEGVQFLQNQCLSSVDMYISISISISISIYIYSQMLVPVSFLMNFEDWWFKGWAITSMVRREENGEVGLGA